MSFKFKKVFDTKDIFLFFLLSVVAILIFCYFLSGSIAKKATLEVRERELGLLIGAIQAGPITFAQLQSSNIAQEQLNRIMENLSLKDRGIISVKVIGGTSQKFVYANWENKNVIDQKCISTKIDSISFPESLNEYVTTIRFDKCVPLPEERAIFNTAILILMISAAFIFITLALTLSPILTSFREAYRHLHQRTDNLNSISFLPLRKLTELADKGISAERQTAIESLAAQVSHDIRSPLGVLEMLVTDQIQFNNNNIGTIKNSIIRIKDIVNSLNSKNMKNNHLNDVEFDETTGRSVEQLWDLVNFVISEKNILHSDRKLKINFDFKNNFEFVFINLNTVEITRVLSNLLDNAIHASKSDSPITIDGSLEGETAILKIIDSGKGMQKESLNKLGIKGFTQGKDGGTGLGFYHAKKVLESLGGTVTVESELNKGTIVKLTLPISPTPRWFCNEISLTKISQIVILDDENEHFLFWENYKSSAIKIIHANSPSELRLFFNEIFDQIDSTLFLINYDFKNTTELGLDIINQLGISNQSIVLTNKIDVLSVRNRIEQSNIKVIPKALIKKIVINYE